MKRIISQHIDLTLNLASSGAKWKIYRLLKSLHNKARSKIALQKREVTIDGFVYIMKVL